MAWALALSTAALFGCKSKSEAPTPPAATEPHELASPAPSPVKPPKREPEREREAQVAEPTAAAPKPVEFPPLKTPGERKHLYDCNLGCIEKLVSEPHRELSDLWISGSENYPDCSSLAPAALQRLAQGLNAPNLQHLRVDIGNASELRILLGKPWVRQLKGLTVCTHSAGAKAIAATPFSSLRYLRILSPLEPLESSAVTHLVKSQHLGNLRVLVLAGADSEAERTMENAGWQALVKGFALQNVHHLDLSSSAPSTESVVALVQAPWLAQLRTLNLDRTRLNPQVRDALVKRRPWPNLNKLCLSDLVSTADKDDLQALAAAFGPRLPPKTDACSIGAWQVLSLLAE